MYSKTLVFSLFLFLSISCFSQETKVFVLDMAEPHRHSFGKERYLKKIDSIELDTFSINEKLQIEHDQLVAFKLKNANPFKYNYLVNNEEIDFFVEEQDSFRKGIEKNTLNKATPNPDKTVKTTPTTDVNSLLDDDASKNQLIKATINTIQARINQKSTKVKSLKNLNQVLESDSKNFIFQANMNIEAKEAIEENNRQIGILEKEIDSLKNKIESEKKQLADNRRKNRQLKKQLDRMTEEMNNSKEQEIARKNEYEIQIYKNALILVESNTHSVRQLINEIKLYQAKIRLEDFLDMQHFENKREEFLKSLDDIREVMNSHTLKISRQLSEERTKAYNNLLSDPFGKELKTAQALLNDMFTLKTKNYSFPLAVDGKNIDVVQLKVERTPRNDKSLQSDTHTYDIWVRGGLKVDVSAGLFYSSLVDREYGRRDVKMEGTDEMGQITETTKQALYEKNPGEYQYGFGSMLNVYYRNGSWVNPFVFSVGAALTNNQKLQFLAGGGLILGKRQRIVLNAGISLGSATKLLKTYKADNETLYEFSSDDAIPTVEKFSVGHFFSLTYNLGKIKTQKSITD